jgi:hypothetical protein
MSRGNKRQNKQTYMLAPTLRSCFSYFWEAGRSTSQPVGSETIPRLPSEKHTKQESGLLQKECGNKTPLVSDRAGSVGLV